MIFGNLPWFLKLLKVVKKTVQVISRFNCHYRSNLNYSYKTYHGRLLENWSDRNLITFPRVKASKKNITKNKFTQKRSLKILNAASSR